MKISYTSLKRGVLSSTYIVVQISVLQKEKCR